MSLAIVHSRAANGIDAPEVIVEVHLANGLPSLSIVGLPEAAVRESKDRVRGALLTSHFEFPPRRITINLAPADLPKDGGRFDLPIAIGILAASGQIPSDSPAGLEFVGELALSGELRCVRGVLPVALQCRDTGRSLVVPKVNADEAGLANGIHVLSAGHLLDVCAHLSGDRLIEKHAPKTGRTSERRYPDLVDVIGQHRARRALEIAAAGGHSLLLSGPPGTGKTMLASRLAGILPPMTEEEAIETATIASISERVFSHDGWGVRPFRAPHHTASAVALVGGGSTPRPGEISLAHNGVLFLDELPEFDRKVLEVLREPLESGRIHISRAARQAEFPARFQLVAAMNPCPCGFLGHPSGRCRCTNEQVQRYRTRISGPLLDRIDLHVDVPSLPADALGSRRGGERSEAVRERVVAARKHQIERRCKINALLDGRELEKGCRLQETDARLVERAIERLGLSARAYHRILRVARTIADLEGGEAIQTHHLTEALSYRRIDRTSHS